MPPDDATELTPATRTVSTVDRVLIAIPKVMAVCAILFILVIIAGAVLGLAADDY